MSHMFVMDVMIYQWWFYDLNDFMILNVKRIDYRCDVFNMSKNEAAKLLNNSALDNKGLL